MSSSQSENIEKISTVSIQQKTEVKVTVTEPETEGTEKDLVCLCCPCLPPIPSLICLLAPFTVFNFVKLGLASSWQDSAARTYFILSSIIWLFILPPWLVTLVSRLYIFHPFQSSILNVLNRTIRWLDAHCCNIDIYSFTEILWFLLHLFHILLAVGSASQVVQSVWSIPGFPLAILCDLIISGSELVHGAWSGWQRCKGETEEFTLEGYSLAPVSSIRIKDKYRSRKYKSRKERVAKPESQVIFKR